MRTVAQREVLFRVASVEDLQDLLALVLVLLQQVFVLPHDCLGFLLEVLELRVKHCDLYRRVAYDFFLFEDGFVVGEQEMVEVLQLAEVSMVVQRHFPDFLQFFQDYERIDA